LLLRPRAPGFGEDGYIAVLDVAFRGSHDIQDWLTNFKVATAACSFDGGLTVGRVHSGFLQAYKTLREPLAAKVRLLVPSASSGQAVLCRVLGHSLGGAMATLCAYDLAASSDFSYLGADVSCVTWGSPRVGDAEFAASYRSAVPRTARFVTRMDIVPRLPVNPQDPNDDGEVLGGRIQAYLLGQQARITSGDFHHVCKSMLLGPAENGFLHLAESVASGLHRREVGTALEHFVTPHRLGAYEEKLSQGKVDTGVADTFVQAARVATFAAPLLGQLGHSLWSRRQKVFQPSAQDDQSAGAASDIPSSSQPGSVS